MLYWISMTGLFQRDLRPKLRGDLEDTNIDDPAGWTRWGPGIRMMGVMCHCGVQQRAEGRGWYTP